MSVSKILKIVSSIVGPLLGAALIFMSIVDDTGLTFNISSSSGLTLFDAPTNGSGGSATVSLPDDSIYGGASLHTLLDGVDESPKDTRYTVSSSDPGWQTVVTSPVNDGAADDGELHDGWNSDVSYSYEDNNWSHSGNEYISAYDERISVDLNVDYPQLTGDNANFGAINQEIERVAKQWVSEAYDNPTSQNISVVKAFTEDGGTGMRAGSNALLKNKVTYAITYNSEDLISICFSENYFIGSVASEFLVLRTVNANLKTGQVYTFDDVLTMDDDIANQFVSTLARNDSTFSVGIYGREKIVAMLEGTDAESWRTSSCLFVDGNGKVNLGVTYWFSNNGNIERGWWDCTLTDEELASAKKSSDFWSLLPTT